MASSPALLASPRAARAFEGAPIGRNHWGVRMSDRTGPIDRMSAFLRPTAEE